MLFVISLRDRLRHYLLVSSPLLLALSCNPQQAIQPGPETNVRIIVGTSSEAYPVLEILTEAYNSEVQGVEFQFVPSLSANTGISHLNNDFIDISGISHDISVYSPDSRFNYLSLVDIPMVPVVHGSVDNVVDITKDQLIAIYDGRIKNWKALGGPDQEILLFTHADDSIVQPILKDYLGSNVTFSSEAIIFKDEHDLYETVTDTEFSIAVMPLCHAVLESSLNILSVDGMAPSIHNLHTEAHPMNLSIGIMYPESSSQEVQSFIQFATQQNIQTLLVHAH